jgi:hypothetical protein
MTSLLAPGQNPAVQTCAKSCGSREFFSLRPSCPEPTEFASRKILKIEGAAFTVGGSLIAADSTQDSNFPAHTLSIGQTVIVSPLAPLDASWAGIVWTAFVSAVNQVTIRLANVTAGGITPAAQPFVLKAFYDASL